MTALPEEVREAARGALAASRAFRAGVAFGVPLDAYEQHRDAVTDAVLAAVAPAILRWAAEKLPGPGGHKSEWWDGEHVTWAMWEESPRKGTPRDALLALAASLTAQTGEAS